MRDTARERTQAGKVGEREVGTPLRRELEEGLNPGPELKADA